MVMDFDKKVIYHASGRRASERICDACSVRDGSAGKTKPENSVASAHQQVEPSRQCETWVLVRRCCIGWEDRMKGVRLASGCS